MIGAAIISGSFFLSACELNFLFEISANIYFALGRLLCSRRGTENVPAFNLK